MDKYTDAEMLDWLEKEENGLGVVRAVVHDDNKFWAVAFNGQQSISHGDEPMDLETRFLIEKEAFRPTIRAAIELAMDEDAAMAAEEE